MIKVKLKSIIAESFWELHKDIKRGFHTHYWLKGGRGSTKSSFISIEIVLGIMRDAQEGKLTNALILRRVKDTLSESVRDQIKWAIDVLGVSDEWHVPEAKLTITYKPTGQVIRFKGADNPKKVKSTKVPKGYIKYIWYEEVDEFEGKHKIDTINQSLMRGGPKFFVFYSFNPPESQRNWTNMEVLEEREDKFIHHSTYLTVPKGWLGEQFLIEAEHLKKVNKTKYDHDYLGAVTGTGGEVFLNVTVRKITDEEISNFDRIRRGIDWGYATDPFSYIVMNYDKTRRRLYIYYEIYKTRLSNRAAAELIKKENKLNRLIIADSAEPKSVSEMREYGLEIKKAKKGPGSVEFGIKFLQGLEEIIIDQDRCPNTAREFLNYELEKDNQGNFKAEFPDKDNHTIDATRYGLELDFI